MCLDELPLAIEGDVGIVSVVAKLSHLGHQVPAVKAHVVCILGGSEMLFQHELVQEPLDYPRCICRFEFDPCV